MSTPTELAALGGHSQAHQDAIYWVAFAVFAGVVLALLLLYRHSQRCVELEEIDEFLRKENVL
jgi:hypothetical protein